MKQFKFISGIVIIFLLFSCKNNYEIIKDTLPKGSIKLRYQVQNKVTDNLLLEVIDLNDSRCPVGAVCADAGSVKIDISVLSSKGTGTATVYFTEIPNPLLNADTVAGFRIEVVEVTPIPYLNKPVETDSIYCVYVLTKEL
jgi:hypothetical protein